MSNIEITQTKSEQEVPVHIAKNIGNIAIDNSSEEMKRDTVLYGAKATMPDDRLSPLELGQRNSDGTYDF